MTDVPLSLRPAVEGDCALLFEWANDPETRRNSFSAERIRWPEHREWFARLLGEPDRWLYLLMAPGDEPIGQVRFERLGEREAEVSMSLAAAWRGRGLASDAIRLATDRAMRDAGLELIHAHVKPANAPSLRAFLRAGYAEHGAIEHRGHEAVHLTAGRR
jgi:RimJ/RimL family protein N-acetyltransferase